MKCIILKNKSSLSCYFVKNTQNEHSDVFYDIFDDMASTYFGKVKLAQFDLFPLVPTA